MGNMVVTARSTHTTNSITTKKYSTYYILNDHEFFFLNLEKKRLGSFKSIADPVRVI